MTDFQPVLMQNVSVENSRRLEVYRRYGGYQALEKARTLVPEDIVEQVKQSGLRGRGGAGFSTGLKWSLLPKDRNITYLCVNGDEAEPGTFCNRVLIDADPHQVIEGVLITAYAIRAQSVYLYLRDEYTTQADILQTAVNEARNAGLIPSELNLHLHQNAGAYIAGEETALLESIEGKRPWPRVKPPFPAASGLFGRPTVINNVETLACVTHIVQRGADWFQSVGTPKSTGPKMFCVSGHVNKPGCFEFPMGVNLKTLIFDAAGGIRGGKKIKAVNPGGISTGFLTAGEIEVPMDFESFSREKNGCLGVGTGAVTVLDEDTDMLRVLHNTARFFAHESCGQCTQCREGTGWAYKITSRLLAGGGRNIDLEIIEELTEHMGMMTGHSICGLSDGAAYPLRTIIQKFRPELEERIEERKRISPMIMSPNMEAQWKATYDRVRI
jgi:NADH-quinone oxidoreductase subunit F